MAKLRNSITTKLKWDQYIGIVIFGLFLIWVFYQTIKRDQLLENREYTFAFIYDVESGAKGNGKYWKFTYYVDGKQYTGRDGAMDNHTIGINKYCMVYYSIENPELCEIYYDHPPLDVNSILANSTEIVGEVVGFGLRFKNSKEIKYKYTYKDQEYQFMSRLPDSIIDANSINDKGIKVQVSPKYPYINNLYFLSILNRGKSNYNG